jgi:hypothetical protein
MNDTAIFLPFQHKLNYFLFCWTFEILFIICVKILIKSKVQLSSFETFHNSDLRLKQSRHIRLFHNIDKTLFIIFYKHCLQKNLKIIKPSVEVKKSNLINYSTICCQNGQRTTVIWNNIHWESI